MKNQIVLDFGDIIQELADKKLKLCLVKDKSWFVIDAQENMYHIEIYWHGAYLDRLIKDSVIVNFNLIDATKIKDWEKEIWDVSEVKDFIKRQSL